MIRSFIRRLLGLGSDDSDEQDREHLRDYSLYEIGDVMCRHYEDGMPSQPKAKHFGDVSMREVLHDEFGHGELESDMVRQLDRLTREAEMSPRFAKKSGGVDPDKVERFRRIFFRLFDDDEIASALGELYHEIREDIFGLDSLVEEMAVDGFEFHYTKPQDFGGAQVAMEDESLQREPVDFEERSVEMRKVGAKIDLGTAVVTNTIRDFVEEEAGLLWDAVDVSDESDDLLSDDDVVRSLIEAQHAVRAGFGDPDTVVTNGWFEVPDDHPSPCDVVTDETGAMDVPFVVADSNGLGYRLTNEELSFTRQRKSVTEQDLFVMRWSGNYVATQPDMVSGPK